MAYNKQNFYAGDILRAVQLNAMDEQIAANELALEGKQPKGDYPTNGEVDEKISQLQQGLSDYLTKTEASEEYQPKGDYLTEHQPLKTINGQSIIGDGDIEIVGGGENTEALPDYWATYLESKISEINTLTKNGGWDIEPLIFLTDTHIPNNYGKSPMVINELCKRTRLRKVFTGGDMIESA